jgi:hypothetical protein
MRFTTLAFNLVEASQSGSSIEKDLSKAKNWLEIFKILKEFSEEFYYKFKNQKFDHLDSIGVKVDVVTETNNFMLKRLQTFEGTEKLYQNLIKMNLSGLSKLKYKKEAIKHEGIFHFGNFGEVYSRSRDRKLNPQKSDIKKTVSELQKKLDAAFAPDLLIVTPTPRHESTMSDDGGRVAFTVYLGPKIAIAVEDALNRSLNLPDNLKYVDFPTEKELSDYLKDKIGTRSNGYFYFGRSLLTVEPIGYGKIVRGDDGITKYGVHISIRSKNGGLTEDLGRAIRNVLLEKYRSIYRYYMSPIFNISRSEYKSYGTFDGLSYFNIDPNDDLLALWSSKALPKYKMDVNFLEPANERWPY